MCVLLDEVAGSSIRFVNNRSTEKTIQNDDSIRIPVTIIPAGNSFIYKFIHPVVLNISEKATQYLSANSLMP